MPKHLSANLIVASGTGSLSPNSVVNITTRTRGTNKTIFPSCWIRENKANLFFGGGASAFSSVNAVNVALARTTNANEYILKAYNNNLTEDRTLEWKLFEI
jgi:hypothetical protein